MSHYTGHIQGLCFTTSKLHLFLPLQNVVGYFLKQLSLGIHVDISYEYPLQPRQMTTNYVILPETN